MNQIVIVGSIIDMPSIQSNNSTNYARILLNVQRAFKNSDGVYESDQIMVTLWRGITESVLDYCKVGCVLALRGRIKSIDNVVDGIKTLQYEFIAEHVKLL